MSCNAPDCSIPTVELEANPDISGIGVLVGFLVTAWVTFLIILFHYVAVPYESSSSPLDSSLRRSIQKVFRWNPSGRWAKPLKTVMLAMSDQQLVTGIAILVGGYSQLQCGLSLYHWQMVTTLTWFSTTTHFATLPFLQHYLRRNMVILYLRVVLMFALAIMLAIALIPEEERSPTAYTVSRPAKCIMERPDFGFDIRGAGANTVISEFILLGALFVRFVRLFPASRDVSTKSLQFVRTKWRNSIIWCCEKLERFPQWTGLFTALPLVLWLVGLISAQVFLDFLRSGAFEVAWLFFSLIWGTIRLFIVRSSLPEGSNILDEDSWGFGQFVPVLLLFVPVLLIAEGWSEMATKEHDHRVGFPQPSIQLPLNSLDEPSTQTQNPLGPPVSFRPSTIASSSSSIVDNSPIHSRIKAICTSNFREEGWYLTTLYFTLSCLVSMAPVILAQAPASITSQGGPSMAIWIAILLGGVWFAIVIIPFNMVLDGLQGPKSKSKHWPLSINRIITDQGRYYHVFRCTCCLVCITCSVVGLVMTFPDNYVPAAQLVMMYFSGVTYMVVFTLTLIIAIFSLWSLILFQGS